jgi:hypothetical protein
MSTINTVKQLRQADTPLLFFECILPSGDPEYWSSHAIEFNGNAYAARVLKHNLFDLQLSADDAMDGISQLSLTLANADSELTQINSAIGFKGSQLTVYFAFADLPSQTITTESTVLFRGIAGDPNEITEESLVLSFTNKLSLQRIPVPEVRVQRACPWMFPSSPDQRLEALDGGALGRYSRLYRCGYSADIPGGVGNLNAGQAFTSCDKSRAQCTERGMFDTDNQGNANRRFGGFEFVPSAMLVRTSGDKTTHLSPILNSAATYNDAVPVVYGTGWLKAPIVLGRNDGNLTHMEVLLSLGAVQGLRKGVVNDVEIPQAVQGTDMNATGWYSLVSSGTRNGNFDLNFTDSNGNPLGDPYGSMSVLSIVVPNRIASGRSNPNVEVLLNGLGLDTYNLDGSFAQTMFTNNPAWVILDILRRCGWSTTDLNLLTFAASAAFCGELISTVDLNGNVIQVPRYECNLLLTKRQSAAVVIRGIRVASSLMLRYGQTGLLELLPEAGLAGQQPTLPDGSNSTESLAGGWPAYEFSDASGPFSGIVRNADGSSSVRLTSRSIAETSNRLSVEFQDESNEYQQDSLSLVDADDSALIGYEIASQSTALGIANFSQATRVLLRQLDKSTKGNLYVQFETSFRALKVRPGDIIALTYQKAGFNRAPFRVVKLSPSMNYQLVTVLAQIHDDAWYSDNPATLGGAGRQPGMQVGTPRPLIGTVSHKDANGNLEYFDFGVAEEVQSYSSGAATDILTVSFAEPSKPDTSAVSVPLLSLAPQYSVTGGTLPNGTNYYYAISAVNAAGDEGPISFTVAAQITSQTNTNTVAITGISLPPGVTGFNVYRGSSPQTMYRIASAVPPASIFTDTGYAAQPIGPPDSSFDHANFYYRYQYAGPLSATAYSATTIANENMGATPRAYAGMAVLITEGTGRGQERVISSNDATTLTLSSSWSTVPDGTSVFVVCQASWAFAAVSKTTPIQFEIPYQAGTVVQITGRAANVSGLESDPLLAPITSCALGNGSLDAGVAAPPTYNLNALGAGNLMLFNVAFADLRNTASIADGTLELFCWSELDNPSAFALASALDTSSTTMVLNGPGTAIVGQTVAIGQELFTVVSNNAATNTYSVTRGSLGSTIAPHNTGDPVFHLSTTAIVVPFAANFFQGRAASNFEHTFSLPDVRVYATQFYVTNSFGNSQSTTNCYTLSGGQGLRTLSGGQFAFQVSGYLMNQTNAAPPFLVEAAHAVRDIRAIVNEAPQGYKVTVNVYQNGVSYAQMIIASGQTTSNIVDGTQMSPLTDGSSITIDVTLESVAPAPAGLNPGRDLSVVIRL